MREKPGFRENLEFIRSRTEKKLLGKTDVMRIYGMSRPSVAKHITFNGFGKITPEDLARQIGAGR